MQYTQPISFSPVNLINAATVVSASVTGAAAGVTASLPAASGKLTFIEGFTIAAAGATAASSVIMTITGLATQLNYDVTVLAGATLAVPTIDIRLPTPIPGSAVNTAVALTLPSLGGGNTSTTLTAYGFQA